MTNMPRESSRNARHINHEQPPSRQFTELSGCRGNIAAVASIRLALACFWTSALQLLTP